MLLEQFQKLRDRKGADLSVYTLKIIILQFFWCNNLNLSTHAPLFQLFYDIQFFKSLRQLLFDIS
jgi:hypothetical protein